MKLPLSSNQLKAILGESFVASLAATVGVLLLDLPIWAVFIGWIAFFTRGITATNGAINLVCVLAGLGIGIAAATANIYLEPHLGRFTVTLTVLAVTFVVLTFQALPTFNNLLGFFLGLVCYFASGLPPTFESYLALAVATALGILAGLLASLVKVRFTGGVKPQAGH